MASERERSPVNTASKTTATEPNSAIPRTSLVRPGRDRGASTRDQGTHVRFSETVSTNEDKEVGAGVHAAPELEIRQLFDSVAPSSRTSVLSLKETWQTIFCQTSFPLFSAGVGLVCTGVLLNYIQDWRVFSKVPEFMILTTPLLGLKGDLEMTLASRMSTSANLGFITTRNRWRYFGKDICLTQVQAVAVGFMAAFVAIFFGVVESLPIMRPINPEMALILIASSVVTAALASLILDFFMFTIVVISKRIHVNPDNIATPLAGVMGDMITLLLLAFIGEFLYEVVDGFPWVPPMLTGACILMNPFFIWISYRSAYTRMVLLTGWVPVVVSMFLSSGGGYILTLATFRFRKLSLYQPLINGVGANMAAIQASRLSTTFHKICEVGELPPSLRGPGQKYNPYVLFCGSAMDSVSTRVLLAMVIPGQLIFMALLFLISQMDRGGERISKDSYHDIAFVFLYCLAAMTQTAVLIYFALVIICCLWEREKDPDTNTIPYLTGLGDLIGTGLLFIAFELYHKA